MKCQNCDAEVTEDTERCEKCGAKLLNRKVVLGVPRNEGFTLTAEAEPSEADEPDAPPAAQEWQFPARGDTPPAAPVQESPAAADIVYGGFFRRCGAIFIDAAAILLLSALLAVMAYIGYKVGLAAHGRNVSWDNAMPLVGLLAVGWIVLATVYFVLFHGMQGQTVGKWLLGLRVVDAAQQSISYRRALLRWIGIIGLGCASLGLSLCWVFWSGEKRAWHDFLARTWVIRV